MDKVPFWEMKSSWTLLKDIYKDSKWYAIIADETTYITNREQVNVCVRWVDEKDLDVHESSTCKAGIKVWLQI